ncbi:MAG: NifB/NifX family molybdenum-iron cluster-binding protein [Methanomethylovorans sp.]|uniref:NifB/NifX family molybdenum-iron cluster-binding protein n=1 Tax=Methanomethylovorans sp. TaxID=2758717 RepID=UPI003530D9B9
MKICVTTKDNSPEVETDPHFGRCMYFMFVDTETMQKEFIKNPFAAESQGAGVRAAQYITDHGADVLISGNPGPNAVSVMETAGIRIVKYPEMKAMEAVQKFLGINNLVKGENMKICVPSMGKTGLEDQVGQHFGKVLNYIMYDTETSEVSILPNTSEHNGGVGLPPELMSKNGVDIMLCGGLGTKAVAMFEQYGIEVFVGAQGTIQNALDAWKDGKLQKANMNNACTSHEHDDHHSHHHH